ncbi:VanZ family protein [Streptomyces sanyensis]|uniref:VanZ family protein n=1 Tax=Streptomyces sanyensis TaxID=568869 RepID=UPI003D77B880
MPRPCGTTAVVVELVQWLGGHGRIVDLDDVLFNSIGTAVGVGLSVAAGPVLKRLRDRRTGAEERA